MRKFIFIIVVGSAVVFFWQPPAHSQWKMLNVPEVQGGASLAVIGNHLFAASRGIFRSMDSGESWIPIDSELGGYTFFEASGTDLYAGSTNSFAVYRSTDEGKSWDSVFINGVPVSRFTFMASGNVILAGTDSGYFHSSDNGVQWASMDTILPLYLNCITSDSDFVYAAGGTNEDNIYRSSDKGAHWIHTGGIRPDTAPAYSVTSMLSADGDIFAGVSGLGIYRSTDSGATWSLANNGLNSYLLQRHIASLISFGGNIYAGLDSGVFRTTNMGNSWEPADSGFTARIGVILISSFASIGNILFAGRMSNQFISDNVGVFRSTDSVRTWSPVNAGLSIRNFLRPFPMSLQDSILFEGSTAGDPYGDEIHPVFRSIDNGGNWDFIERYDIETLVMNNGNLFAGTANAQYDSASGVYRSTDLGENWLPCESTFWDSLFVGIVSSGWAGVNEISVTGDTVFAVANTGTYLPTETLIFRSTDRGVNWKNTDSGIHQGYSYDRIPFVFPAGVVFLSTDSGLYRSTNNGDFWVIDTDGIGVQIISSIVGSSGRFIAASDSGIYNTTDTGTHWAKMNALPGSNGEIAEHGNITFAATTKGLYLSSDSGIHWVKVDSGAIYESPFTSLAFNGSYLFAQGPYALFRRPLADFGVTAVNEKPVNILPFQLVLQQNYPNPFSGMTNIEYRIPNESAVTLTVYNSLGEEVAVPVNGRENAGAHDVSFDASQLPMGVYFCRLQAGTLTAARKMFVVR
jgi:photosystem II stability/assembly factor-like uncharacterized protein